MDEISRLASDISQLTRSVDDVSYRLAVVETQSKHIGARFNKLQASLKDLRAAISRAGWIILAAFLGVLVKFVVDGGVAM